jgi:uncharacterized membrane protein
VAVLATLLFIAYPLLVYLGLVYFDARFVGIIVAVAAGARFMLPRQRAGAGGLSAGLIAGIVVSLAIGIIVAISNAELLLRFYPVCMNVIMLMVFGASLIRPPSIIERIARSAHHNVSEAATRYMRHVTWVWCGFFVANGAAALFTTLFASMEVWALYNGLIAYILIGALLAGECLVRRVRMRRHRALPIERVSSV